VDLTSMAEKLILLINCPDREGLVASVTAVIRRFHGNVVDLDQ
jgi:formyltetrahydrofolate hydrolase